MIRVLFTCGGGAGNEAVFQLWRSKLELHFADASPTSFAPALPSERCHVVPFAYDPSFVSSIAAICIQYAIDVLIPGVDEELPSMPEVAARVPRLNILVPAPNYVTTMADKLKAMAVLRARGVELMLRVRPRWIKLKSSDSRVSPTPGGNALQRLEGRPVQPVFRQV